MRIFTKFLKKLRKIQHYNAKKLVIFFNICYYNNIKYYVPQGRNERKKSTMPEEKTPKPPVKAEKKTAAAKKPAAKKAAPAKKTADKKPAAKPAAKKAPAKKAPPVELTPLDELTILVWKKLEKKDVDSIPFAIAIQVNVREVGTFYVAVNASPNPDEKKQVIQSDYYLADGVLDTSADEIKKIVAGKYDYIAAAKSGAISYRGDLTKGALIAELIK